MSRPSGFATSAEARASGWVSRRYRSSGERDIAVMAFEARVKADRRQAEANAVVNYKRTPVERLARLDDMFGKGNGGKRERARLIKMVEKK